MHRVLSRPIGHVCLLRQTAKSVLASGSRGGDSENDPQRQWNIRRHGEKKGKPKQLEAHRASRHMSGLLKAVLSAVTQQTFSILLQLLTVFVVTFPKEGFVCVKESWAASELYEPKARSHRMKPSDGNKKISIEIYQNISWYYHQDCDTLHWVKGYPFDKNKTQNQCKNVMFFWKEISVVRANFPSYRPCYDCECTSDLFGKNNIIVGSVIRWLVE